MKTGLENTNKGFFNESKLGNIKKNGIEIAKVAFEDSRLQQETKLNLDLTEHSPDLTNFDRSLKAKDQIYKAM